MQALGRRYVAAHNRRHGRCGTLWDGRFRCGVVEPGPTRLQALCLIDGAAADPGLTSAAHRLGGPRDGLLIDPPEYWQLGNTPFEREAAYRRLLDAGVPPLRPRPARRRPRRLGRRLAGFKAGLAVPSRPTQPRHAAGPGESDPGDRGSPLPTEHLGAQRPVRPRTHRPGCAGTLRATTESLTRIVMTMSPINLDRRYITYM